MGRLLLLVFTFAVSIIANAQSVKDIGDKSVQLTWLGIDFTEVNFIGTAAQWQDAGEISNTELRDKYFQAWNQLFIDERQKYNVAEATNRSDVEYAIEVTGAVNSASDRDYFVNNPSAFTHLSKDDIKSMVGKYDYDGNAGLGLMFFVEGMDKEIKKASVWVAFIDMDKKSPVFIKRVEGKAGGFGFRNYWAKSFFNSLNEVEDNLKKWSKG